MRLPRFTGKPSISKVEAVYCMASMSDSLTNVVVPAIPSCASSMYACRRCKQGYEPACGVCDHCLPRSCK